MKSKSKKVVQAMPELGKKKQLGPQLNPASKNTPSLGVQLVLECVVIHAQTLA